MPYEYLWTKDPNTTF